MELTEQPEPINPDLALVKGTRDYSTLRLWTVSWDDFTEGDSLLRNLNIRGFQFRAKLSGLGRWAKLVDSGRVALKVLAQVEEALVEANFVNVPAIETLIDPEGIMFRYSDTEFGFDLTIRGDGTVLLGRSGSSLKTFHNWYVGLLPSMPGILNRLVASLNDEIHRTLRPHDRADLRDKEDVEERIALLQAGFSFEVVSHGFTDDQGDDCRNLDVMRRNVAVRVPDAAGVMHTEQPLDFGSYGRMDYKVSLRHPLIPGISQFLAVEAPSNSDWRGLFFSFDYVGENYFTEDGRRRAVDTALFLSSARAADAYISFFRDIAVRGFLTSVLEGYSFGTTTAVIP